MTEQHSPSVPPRPPMWGDETEIATAGGDAGGQSDQQALRSQDHGPPRQGPRCRGRCGHHPARGRWARSPRIFDEILAPATRAQNGPTNLAYIPAAPTRAALAFDAVVTPATSSGAWEAGAGPSTPRTRRWPGSSSCSAGPTAGGCFVSGGTRQPLRPRRGPAPLRRRRGRHPAGSGSSCAPTGPLLDRSAARALDAEVVTAPVAGDGPSPEPPCAALAPSRRVRRGGDGRDHECRPGRRSRQVADACERTACGCTSTAPTAGRPGGASVRALHRHRARRQLHRRSPQWLFAPYDCCALLYREPRRPAPRTVSRRTTSTPSTATSTTRRTCALHLSRRAAACRSGSAWPSTAPTATRPPWNGPWLPPADRSPTPSGPRKRPPAAES